MRLAAGASRFSLPGTQPDYSGPCSGNGCDDPGFEYGFALQCRACAIDAEADDYDARAHADQRTGEEVAKPDAGCAGDEVDDAEQFDRREVESAGRTKHYDCDRGTW